MGQKASTAAVNRSHLAEASEESNLFITGLGVHWPDELITPDDFEEHVLKWADGNNEGVKKLLKINRSSGIQSRTAVGAWKEAAWNQQEPPKAEELDHYFRTHGTRLAVEACKKAMAESKSAAADITHTVSVTATNAGSPGYDLLVSQQLGLPPAIERTLLSGVGCAGGLSVLRTAAHVANAQSFRKKPARILIFATELCSPQIRVELEEAKKGGDVRIGPALFSDGSAALVMCNKQALRQQKSAATGVYSLLDWTMMPIPDTSSFMAYRVHQLGYLLNLSREVPVAAASGIQGALKALQVDKDAEKFDWALHPGGLSILNGVKEAAQLTDAQIKASYAVYRSKGNTSSVAVLAVLDTMRGAEGREDVLACSFGPGVMVEMAKLKRLR